MKKFNTSLVILLILSSKLLAVEISGFPNITDGDTIKILNKRIRLHGIDVPEAEYRELESLESCGNYLLPKFEAGAAA